LDSQSSPVSYSTILNCLIKVAKQRLTAKQKIILEELRDNSKNATQLVEHLANKLYCSKSALWNNLRELKETGLVSQNNGDACRLTQLGTIISQRLRGEKQ